VPLDADEEWEGWGRYIKAVWCCCGSGGEVVVWCGVLRRVVSCAVWAWRRA
jgi:hypothetical protein